MQKLNFCTVKDNYFLNLSLTFWWNIREEDIWVYFAQFGNLLFVSYDRNPLTTSPPALACLLMLATSTILSVSYIESTLKYSYSVASVQV